MKKKGNIIIYVAMLLTVIFMLPLYAILFKLTDNQVWIYMSLGPGMAACCCWILGRYVQGLEEKIEVYENIENIINK